MRKSRDGVAMPDLDLFGEAPAVVGRKSNAGRLRVPLRIMISLLYLKHAFNESDEGTWTPWAAFGRQRVGGVRLNDRITSNCDDPNLWPGN